MKSISGLSFRYMKKNMQRTFMTILGVALSAMLIYSIFSCSISVFNHQKKTSYVSNMGWDAMFVTDGNTACKILSHIEYYSSHPEAVNNISDTEHSGIPDMSYGWIMSMDADTYVEYVNDFRAMPEQFKLVKGTFPNSDRGILISDGQSKYCKYNVGDTYVVPGLKTDEATGEVTRTEAEFTICGIYEDTYYMNYWDQYYPKDATVFGGEMDTVTLMPSEMYEREKVSVYVTYEDKHDITAQTDKLAQMYGIDESNYMVTDVAIECFHKENKTETAEYDMFVVVILALGGLASLAVIFIVRNAFNISVHERSNDYGILRCIGLTRRQIVYIIMWEAFTVGIIGTVCGIIIGHLVCGIGFKIISQSFDYLGGYHITVEGIVWTLLCMLIVTCYAMTSPIEKLYKLNPIEALRRVDEINAIEKNMSKRKRKKSAKAIENERKRQEKLETKRAKKADRYTGRFGVEAGYAYKNIMRTKGAFTRTVVTLTIGGSLFVGGSVAMKGMKSWMFDEVNLESYSGSFICENENEYKIIKKDISGLDCVEKAQVSAINLCNWNEVTDYVYRDKVTFIGLEKADFDELLNMAEKGNEAKPDNAINVIALTGDFDETERHKSLGFSELNPQINILASVSSDTFSEYALNVAPSVAYYEFNGNEVYVYCLETGVEQYMEAPVTEALNFSEFNYNVKVNKKAHDYYKFSNYVQNSLHYYMDISAELDILTSVINILKFIIEYVMGLVLVIFFINSMNQQTAQMMLRKGELEILSVIGMSKKQRNKMLLIETMAGVVVALVLSLIVGYVFGNLINIGYFKLNFLDEENVVMPGFTIDWLSMVITSVLLLGLGYLTSRIVSREAE